MAYHFTTAALTTALTGNSVSTFNAASDAVDLKADTITAAKFDESTAFPVKSADTGATAIARTGADGDTLATISGQADTITTNVGTALTRLGAWTGTGVNNVLGAFKALLSKTATTPTDIGGTFDPTTDSTEAVRDQGDTAWAGAGLTTDQNTALLNASSVATKLDSMLEEDT